MTRRLFLFGLFAVIIWWLAGEGDKRVRERYDAVRREELIDPLGTLDYGELLEELDQEVS